MLNIELANKALAEIAAHYPSDIAAQERYIEGIRILMAFIKQVETLDKRKCITKPAALLMPPVKGV